MPEHEPRHPPRRQPVERVVADVEGLDVPGVAGASATPGRAGRRPSARRAPAAAAARRRSGRRVEVWYDWSRVVRTTNSCASAAQVERTRNAVQPCVLSTFAAVAQVFVVRTTRDQAYHTSAALSLRSRASDPAAARAGQHADRSDHPEAQSRSGRHRYPWYIQSFNISNYTLNGTACLGDGRASCGPRRASPEPGRVLDGGAGRVQSLVLCS